MQNQSTKKALAAIIIIGGVVLLVLALPKKQTETNQEIPEPVVTTRDETATTSVQESTASTSANTNGAEYKDGTYSDSGTYKSPGGTENVKVTLTLKDDVVVDVTAVPTSDNNTSKRYQAMFVSGYKALVVGKKIEDVKLDKVSGSSLTGIGFNEAVAKIKVKAQS